MENNLYQRPQINLTRALKFQNYYTDALNGEFQEFAFNEERASLNRGKWRSDVFRVSEYHPIDLEVGTGNGGHFQHRSMSRPERGLIGIELKYKPLIQTIRGCLKNQSTNARVCRYHAMNLDLLFEPGELNDIFIHFPDPWVTPRKPRHRFVNTRILNWLWELQRPGSYVDFKTDSREYFLWSMEQIRESKYKIVDETLNLHSTELKETNFITQFETIFMRQNIEINFVRLQKI